MKKVLMSSALALVLVGVSPLTFASDSSLKSLVPASKLKKISGNVRFEAQINNGKSDITITSEGVKYSDNEGRVDVGPMTVKRHATQGLNGLWFGNTQVNVEHFTLGVAQTDVAVIKGIGATVHLKDKGDKVDLGVSLAMNNVADAQGNLGSGRLNATFTSLDAKAASELVKLAIALQRQRSLPGDQGQEPLMMIGFKAIPSAMKLIDGAGLNGAIHISSKDLKGDVKASFKLQAPQNPDQLLGPKALMAKTQGVLEVVMDKSIAREFLFQNNNNATPADIDHQLKQYVKQGWFKRQGSKYTTQITLKNSTLYANGHQLFQVLGATHASETGEIH